MRSHRLRSSRVVRAVVVAAVLACGIAGTTDASASIRWPNWPPVLAESFGHQTWLGHGVVIAPTWVRTGYGVRSGWVARVSLDQGARLSVVQARDRIGGGGEVLTSMVRRSRARVAVNGDFFRIWGDSSPINEVVVGGRLLHSQRPTGPGYGQLTVTSGGQVVIGSAGYRGWVVASDGARTALGGVNTIHTAVAPPIEPAGTAFSQAPVYINGFLGHSVTLGSDGVVARIRLVGGRWTVVWVGRHSGFAPPTGGDVFLAGTGAAGRWMLAHLRTGRAVHMGYETSPASPVQALGGGQILVGGGKIVLPPGGADLPRAMSAIGVSRDGRTVWLVTFNGTSRMGLNRYQLAGWLLAHGAWNAMMFDAGGSAEMAATIPGRGPRVLNSPSDGRERPLANALVITSR